MKSRQLVASLSLCSLIAVPASAQTISTTQELKSACESSPGHVVDILTDVVIHQGAELPAVESIDTGCTLVIGSNAKLTVHLVGLSFAGPFHVQSAFKTEVKVQEASIAATSMEWNLPATDSGITLQAAGVATTAGDLDFALGEVGKIEVVGMLPSAISAIDSFGTLSISGGRLFQGLFAGANISSGVGIMMSLAGAQPQVIFANSDVTSAGGPIQISSSGSQGLLEVAESVIRGNAIGVSMGGAESQVKTSLSGWNATTGSLVMVSGSGDTASKGLVEATQSWFYAAGEINFLASRTANEGVVLVDASRINGKGGVRLVTGDLGLTSFENSVGSSERLFVLRTGAGGTCRNTSNTITSPSQLLCV